MNTLVDKLDKAVKDEIKHEKDVLYILALSRKYMELNYSIEEKQGKYPALSLFSDWVLHTKLEGSAAKKKLKAYADYLSQLADDTSYNFMTSEFTLFAELKADISLLCKEIGIDSTRLMKKTRWRTFIRYLVQIILDQPLLHPVEGITFKFTKAIIVSDKETISFSVIYKSGWTQHFSIDLDILTV